MKQNSNGSNGYGMCMGILDEVEESLGSEEGDGTIEVEGRQAVTVSRETVAFDGTTVNRYGELVGPEPGPAHLVYGGVNAHINTAADERISHELALLCGKALPAGNPLVDSAASEAMNRLHAGIPAHGESSQEHIQGVRIRPGKFLALMIFRQTVRGNGPLAIMTATAAAA